MTSEGIEGARAEPAELLSVAMVSLLLDPWLAGRDVESLELLPGGVANRNFLLRLNGRPRECVLRLYDRDPAACTREVAVLGLVGRDLPVPRVLYVEESPEMGPPLSVLSVIDGISLDTLRSFGDDEALASAAFETGRTLAGLSRFPGPPMSSGPLPQAIDAACSTPTFERRVESTLRRELRAFAERWAPRVEEAAHDRCLVHGDFTSCNVFVTRGEDGWRVSALLDWELAASGSPYRDIGRLLRFHRADRPRYEPAFSEGLRAGGMQLPDDWLTIARVSDLPHLCEVLGRPTTPDAAVDELLALLRGMTADG
jgi:aminoglycoside phosphotransferase (APT) family kinase protein